MPVPVSDSRRILGAALLTGVLVAIAFVTFSWSRLLLTSRTFDGASPIVLGVVIEGPLATEWFVPFLLAVLIVVADPTWRTVTGSTVLVYVFDLLMAIGQTLLSGFPVGIGLTILAVPLASVVHFLAIATAVWLAYHGGYERLLAATGNADQRPLFAVIATISDRGW